MADGMNRFSFHAFISWSPVIAQYGHSLYGLLGTKVSPQQVEELRAQRRASRANHRVLDRHGRTDDGRVWLSYRLSKAASTYAVITVPAALKKVVHGRFQLLRPDGRPIGHVGHERRSGLGARGVLSQAGRADRRPDRPYPRSGKTHGGRVVGGWRRRPRPGYDPEFGRGLCRRNSRELIAPRGWRGLKRH